MGNAKTGKIKNTIIIVLLVALVGGYYFYLSNRRKAEAEVEVTAVHEVLLRDLEANYPPTPKEVVKYYIDITKCLHNESYTDEELGQMADKLLAIYDDELVANNPRDQYISSLKKDVGDFTGSGYSIVSYTVSSSTDVQEYVYEGRKCARLYCIYSIKTGAEYKSSKYAFVLRKETGTGHWKIMGFEPAGQDG